MIRGETKLTCGKTGCGAQLDVVDRVRRVCICMHRITPSNPLSVMRDSAMQMEKGEQKH
jgi:hypothetical protein